MKTCDDINEQKRINIGTVKKLAGYNSNPPAADLIINGIHIQENIEKAAAFAHHLKKPLANPKKLNSTSSTKG